MNTYGDIRTRFEVALNERATTIEGIIFPSLRLQWGLALIGRWTPAANITHHTCARIT